MFKATGKIIYEPNRQGSTKRPNPWWVVVDISPSIANYYRNLVERTILNPPWAVNGIKLQPPMWGSHVTVLDGRIEVPQNKRIYWKKYHNKTIEIQYSHNVEQRWKFWVLPVECQFLNHLRQELGLNPNYPFHITVGRMD